MWSSSEAIVLAVLVAFLEKKNGHMNSIVLSCLFESALDAFTPAATAQANTQFSIIVSTMNIPPCRKGARLSKRSIGNRSWTCYKVSAIQKRLTECSFQCMEALKHETVSLFDSENYFGIANRL